MIDGSKRSLTLTLAPAPACLRMNIEGG